VQRFTTSYEALLQRIAANPTASLPGFEPEPVNCISLSALRYVMACCVIVSQADCLTTDPTWSKGRSHSRVMCTGRDRCLRAEGFQDAFRTVKAEENAKALALLPTVIRCTYILRYGHHAAVTCALRF
jgi:hypothetical protein